MRAICVDDEPLLLGSLIRAVKQSADIESAEGFENAADALAWAAGEHFDIAFLDIELHGTDGITLAEKLRELNGDCGLIYCTGYKSYALKTIEKHIVDGYLLKPIDEDEVQREIDHYKERHHKNYLLSVKDSSSGMSFFDRSGNLLSFRRGKTNELLTILVKAGGAVVTTAELCNLLWKDNDAFLEKNKDYLWKLVTDLKTQLRAVGAEDVFVKAGDGYAVKMKMINHN